MFRQSKRIALVLVIVAMFSLAGCQSYDFAETGNDIVATKDAMSLINDEAYVLVDVQEADAFEMQHIKGAVNVPLSSIVVNDPVKNMMGTEDIVIDALENAGISNDSSIIIYDDINNMDAARLWFTLKYYGHDNAQVIGGGLKQLIANGAETETGKVMATKGNFEITEVNDDMIIELKDIRKLQNEPQENIKLIDVRSQEEYDAGTIPTSIHFNYVNNNYVDGEYKKFEDIQILYIDNGMTPDDELIMYCKTSIRAAQTYLALYNAGYRNLKLYDGAWLEYCSYSFLPVQYPEGNEIEFNQQDNS